MVKNNGKDLSEDILQVSEIIFAYIQAQTILVSAKQICRAIKGRKQIKLQAINLLVSKGKIEMRGKGVRGSPRLYHLATNPGEKYDVLEAIK